MRQSLSMKLRQQLAITPELKQSLRLLQASSLELRGEIQQVLETNPLLELATDLEEVESVESSGTETPQEDAASPEEAEVAELFEQESLPQDLPVDAVWEDTWLDAAPRPSGQRDDFDSLASQAQPDSLIDDLLWQLEVSRIANEDRAIARAIIYSINEDGWLTEPLERIVEGLEDEPILESRCLAVLTAVQTFDPAGVGARNLRECLCLQLREFRQEQPGRELAFTLVNDHLSLLAQPDIAPLAKATGVSEEEVSSAMALILALNPHPGRSVRTQRESYLVPDVVVRKQEGAWRVELNAEAWPSLGINPLYSRMIQRGDKGGDNQYLKDKLGEARWFLRGLRGRGETLLRVASEIVTRQRAFLERGPEAMLPLVLQDISNVLGLHESTVSRVTSGKYMQTPHGLFELKHFFPPALATQDGSEVSSVAIRARIRKLVGEEDPRRPLSDANLMQVLRKEGIRVARRTVAKYRESMAIPSSSARRVR